MPLKESVFDSSIIDFDNSAEVIRSANTLIREKGRYLATSTDQSAFERLLAPYSVGRVAIIGGGGTARAAVGAIVSRTEKIDLLLRTPDRATIMRSIAPFAEINVLPMSSSLSGYDVVINTSPAGVADHLSRTLENVDGILIESLYKPWPTELSFAWKELGGRVLTGADLLVEQALDAITLICKVDFDYTMMRAELLTVALEALNPQI
jgi:shikimate dehydrogenase